MLHAEAEIRGFRSEGTFETPYTFWTHQNKKVKTLICELFKFSNSKNDMNYCLSLYVFIKSNQHDKVFFIGFVLLFETAYNLQYFYNLAEFGRRMYVWGGQRDVLPPPPFSYQGENKLT